MYVKVEYHQFGLFCAVPGPDGAHQFGGVGTDTPHHPTAASALERDQVSDKLPCKEIGIVQHTA